MPKEQPSWEIEAEAAIEAILEDIQYDVLSNSVRIDADWERDGHKEELQFEDASDLEEQFG